MLPNILIHVLAEVDMVVREAKEVICMVVKEVKLVVVENFLSPWVVGVEV